MVRPPSSSTVNCQAFWRVAFSSTAWPATAPATAPTAPAMSCPEPLPTARPAW
jgi:hypothetical protein